MLNMNSGWTDADSDAARVEGWDVWNADDRELQIQRYDELEMLPDDEAAWRLVVAAAHKGSPLHLKALRVISQDERDRIAKLIGTLP